MMKNIENLKDLQTTAIAIRNPIRVKWPQFNKEEIFTPAITKDQNMRFAMNNGTIAFVCDDTLYVIPYMKVVYNLLMENGFSPSYFYVPFSNWDFPVQEERKWLELREMQKQAHHEDFLWKCAAFAEGKGFGRISDADLSRCFKMPEDGVNVKHPYFSDTYYPILRGDCFDSMTLENIGHYCCNNGTFVFVYIDGSTYVTRDYGVVDALQDAGYTESGLFVPFSNGEEITDKFLEIQWKRCCA